MKNKPTTLALLGYVLLLLTPFSILNNMQLFSISVAIVVFIRLLQPVHFYKSQKSGRKLIGNLNALQIYLIITIYLVFGSTISIIEILINDKVDENLLLYRTLSQFGALSVYFLMIVCGYEMATHFDHKKIGAAITLPIYLMLFISSYQLLAFAIGYKYIGLYAFDPNVGLRPSGLTGEPKYLSSYLAVAIYFLISDISVRDRWFPKLVKIIGLTGSIFFFIKTSSGNGVLAIATLTIVTFIRLEKQQKFSLSAVLFAGLLLISSMIDIDDLVLRDSHQLLFDNNASLNIILFDDLIALPLMAWGDNITKLLFGFGPGLMHFFAHRYINYAKWVDDSVFIDGNLGFISYVSNYGLIFFTVIFIFFSIKSFRLIRKSKGTSCFSNTIFFTYCFFVGALVQGNLSIPFYLALGWILGQGLANTNNHETI